MLYRTVSVLSCESLMKLVRSLMRFPVVSRLSARQQARWQTLDDKETREREVKHLTVTISGIGKKANTNIFLVGQMLGAIWRKCSLIHVKLEIEHAWPSAGGTQTQSNATRARASCISRTRVAADVRS